MLCSVNSPVSTQVASCLPLLTADQEHELAWGVAQGDVASRNRLVESNIGLVRIIVRHYVGRGLDLDDLVSEGTLGLFEAATRYDPAFDTRFSTYAAYWIKQAVRKALTNTGATIRLPAHMVNLLAKWRRTERLLNRELGQHPSFNQVAVSLGLTERQCDQVRHAQLTRQFQEEDDTMGERPGGESEGPGSVTERREESSGLRARMAERLDARECLVVELRFGLESGNPLTLKEAGDRLGISRESVRKIERRAVSKLRERAGPVRPRLIISGQ